jgi:hypothetical protein
LFLFFLQTGKIYTQVFLILVSSLEDEGTDQLDGERWA